MIKVINESVHDEMENAVVPVTPDFSTPVDMMQDTPADAMHTESKGVVDEPAPEHEVDYTDPKYQKIVKYLNDNGYPGSKFLGKMGFYIPQDTSYVSIVFDNIFSECSIMTSRFRLSPPAATEYMAELTKVIPIVDAVNAILADATTDESKDRHVSESVDSDSSAASATAITDTNKINESAESWIEKLGIGTLVGSADYASASALYASTKADIGG